MRKQHPPCNPTSCMQNPPPLPDPRQGSFGTVWRGLLQNKIDVAVKREHSF